MEQTKCSFAFSTLLDGLAPILTIFLLKIQQKVEHRLTLVYSRVAEPEGKANTMRLQVIQKVYKNGLLQLNVKISLYYFDFAVMVFRIRIDFMRIRIQLF
jgi:hypothetical protein